LKKEIVPTVISNQSTPPGATPAGEAVKIRIEGLQKKFGNTFVAIDNITLEIQNGQFFVIVGPSGCGKTTLLRILAGLEKPSSGKIDLLGATNGRSGNAMVFQGDSLLPWYSVFENAAYGLRLRKMPEKTVQDTVRPLLESVGLWRFRGLYPYQLSGGMRQRVSIVRAFAVGPEILLMDEPFSALDEQNRLILHEELLRIWEQTHQTVVFITHSVDEAVTLGDRIMVMTAQPGRSKALIDVPFTRPRKILHLRSNPAYGALVFRIWEYLREEVQAAKEGEKRLLDEI
jgi:NitT/TauT family transport system ATP-binding protein